MRYCIWQCSPSGYAHSQAFDDIALSLCEAFKDLGHDCKITRYPDYDAINIGLGLNAYNGNECPLPDKLIIYNLEQSNSPWIKGQYVGMLRHYPVWDYSLNNIAGLRCLGVEAKHLPVGYHPCLTRIPKSKEDIDVLFFGSLNDRRLNVIADLASRKLNVIRAFNVYGQERDSLIARAKIVINIHFYGADFPFEIIRCSYLMANKKCIVSETSSENYDGVAWCNYSDLTGTCLGLLSDNERRKALGEQAFESFKTKLQSNYLKAIL